MKTMFIKKFNTLTHISLRRKRNQPSLIRLFQPFIAVPQTFPLSVFNVHSKFCT